MPARETAGIAILSHAKAPRRKGSDIDLCALAPLRDIYPRIAVCVIESLRIDVVVAPRKSSHESHRFNNSAAHCLECFYDVRMVWSLEEPRLEAADCCGAGELGHRILRVSSAGTGQPHRLREVNTSATEDVARS